MDAAFKDVGAIEDRASEECAELIVAIAKARRFGWQSRNPKTGLLSYDQVLTEIADVERVVRELREHVLALSHPTALYPGRGNCERCGGLEGLRVGCGGCGGTGHR